MLQRSVRERRICMSIYKDNVTGKWRVVYRYTDWTGKTKQTSKRGFPTKREAQMWEHEQMLKHDAKLDMTFASFYEIYVEDKKERIRDNTWGTKNNIARTKILPYFGERKIAEIEPKDVIAWQNHLLAFKRANGKGYSASYLRKIHSQLSAIFNHAVDFYHLPSNPAQKAGNIAIEEYKEMLFWTKEEYLKFADVMMDKPVSYYAFEMLYWCGIREGELLALTPADFDFTTHTLRINKSYQRLNREDVITPPKTFKSNRFIKMPQFICDEMQDYMEMLYGLKEDERIFTISKSYLHHEMNRGSKVSGVKRIRVHDLRHSHVSLLINMGFTVLAIADRMGHESIDITYRYAHLFPSEQTQMAEQLDIERMKNQMEKNLDSKGRWRNKIVAFRVSPEEAEQIDACVRLSGLSKQDYITKRLTNREIVVQGNPRVYKALRNQMAEIYEELKRLEKCGEENEELLSTLKLVAETLYGLKGDNE